MKLSLRQIQTQKKKKKSRLNMRKKSDFNSVLFNVTDENKYFDLERDHAWGIR